LAKTVTVFLALLVALVLTGMGYGVWSDTLTISGPVTTAVVDTQIAWGLSWSNPIGSGYIYSVPSGMTIDVHVGNAQADTHYYSDINIVNNTGSLPVKIQSITITPAVATWLTYGFNGSVTFDGGTKTPDEVIGDQIDPGETKTGEVHVFLDGAPVGSNFDVTVEVEVVPWNQ